VSEYSKLREKNIQKNRQILKKLGIQTDRERKKPNLKRKKVDRHPKTPTRRSSRRRKLRRKSFKDMGTEDPSDNDYEPDHDKELQTDDDSEEIVDTHDVQVSAKKIDGAQDDSEAQENFLKVEAAKTGRSTCRKCRNKLEKGETRVGMNAWIAGRNAVTWQHPGCFFSNVSITRESSGRGKCRFSKQSFKKEEPRLTFQSHTAKASIKFSVIRSCLLPLARESKNMLQSEKFHPKAWKGYSELDKNEANSLYAEWKSCMEAANKNTSDGANESAGETKAESEDETKETETSRQPKANKKTGSQGKVAWRWGGCICYGKLLSSRETKSHCYARTHKGNVKTLTKGKSYWWLVDE